jgi:hypothetical protein
MARRAALLRERFEALQRHIQDAINYAFVRVRSS